MKLLLHPHQFGSLHGICRNCYESAGQMYTHHAKSIPVDELCLADFYTQIRYRVPVWKQKNPRKRHTLNVPVSVAIAAHRYLLRYNLDPFEQSLLTAIDAAIINFQYPTA